MIRRVLVLILCCFSMSVFASSDVVSQYLPNAKPSVNCNPHASISSASNFCATFPPAATCNCEMHGMSPPYCASMTNIYKDMLKLYGSLKGACAYPVPQNLTTQQECIDDWNCYWDGGKSSTGNCNGNGKACTTDPKPTG